MRLGRILAGLLVLGALIALGAYWIGPGVVPRADLHLVALDAESRFTEDARLPAADPTRAGGALQPLILAVSNSGQRQSGVRSLSLSVPGWIGLHGADGPIAPIEDDVEEPLRRYEFALDGEQIEPGALPQVPAGLDRMWVSVAVPPITCRLRWDGVPELAPSPPWDAAAMETAAVFYSIEGDRSRHTGVLRLSLEPAALRPAPEPFSADDAVVRRPGEGLPPTDSLTLHGERSSTCGAPGHRMALHATTWRTGANGRGRMVVVRHEGLPRRILLDADGDGRIERERWDGDADGLFEASRAVSFRLPDWILPTDTAVQEPADTTRPSVATTEDSARTRVAVPDTTVARMRPDTMGIDTLAPPDTTVARTPPDTMVIDTLAPPDTTVARTPPDTMVIDTLAPPDTGRAGPRATRFAAPCCT